MPNPVPALTYLPLILFTVLTNAAAQIMLKKGMSSVGALDIGATARSAISPRLARTRRRAITSSTLGQISESRLICDISHSQPSRFPVRMLIEDRWPRGKRHRQAISPRIPNAGPEKGGAYPFPRGFEFGSGLAISGLDMPREIRLRGVFMGTSSPAAPRPEHSPREPDRCASKTIRNSTSRTC